MTIEEFTSGFEKLSEKLFPLFEIEVVDKRTQETDHIIFDISIRDGKFVATHPSLTTEQVESDKISFVSHDIDTDFSIDENLQELYSECISTIIDSDFFELPEE